MNVVYIEHLIHSAAYFLSVRLCIKATDCCTESLSRKNKRHSQINHQIGLGFNIRS